MKTYTHLYELCDKILYTLEKENKKQVSDGLQSHEIAKEIGEHSTKVLYQCVIFMLQEGYLSEVFKGNYAISPTGEFLITNGGYKQKIQDEIDKEGLIKQQITANINAANSSVTANTSNETLKTSTENYYKQLKIATWVIAIATVLNIGVVLFVSTLNTKPETHKQILILPPHLQQLIDTSLIEKRENLFQRQKDARDSATYSQQ